MAGDRGDRDRPAQAGVATIGRRRFDKKLQAQQAGAKAMSEYEAAGAAVRAKTARLRALRLAKEAADKEAAGKAPAAPPPAPKAAKAKKSPVEAQEKPALSDWLASQRDQGRRG
jgi:hypothetical protein